MLYIIDCSFFPGLRRRPLLLNNGLPELVLMQLYVRVESPDQEIAVCMTPHST